MSTSHAIVYELWTKPHYTDLLVRSETTPMNAYSLQVLSMIGVSDAPATATPIHHPLFDPSRGRALLTTKAWQTTPKTDIRRPGAPLAALTIEIMGDPAGDPNAVSAHVMELRQSAPNHRLTAILFHEAFVDSDLAPSIPLEFPTTPMDHVLPAFAHSCLPNQISYGHDTARPEAMTIAKLTAAIAPLLH